MPTTTRRAARTRRLSAVLAGLAVPILLSGCTIVQTLTAPEETVAPGVDEAALDAYRGQEVDWRSCGGGLECATVDAPLDWSDPGAGDDVELALVKLPATGDRLGTLFTNPGGPGGSGVGFVETGAENVFGAEVRERYDIVGWDPRGVGQSDAVECLDDDEMDALYFSFEDDPSPSGEPTEQEIIDATVEFGAWFGKQCERGTGDLLEFVDTLSTVDDLDLLRELVGDPQLNYFGFSYGTDIGAQYIDRYPQNVGRIALDGATDPTLSAFEIDLAQQAAFGDANRAYLADCLSKPGCPFTGTVDEAIAQVNALLVDLDETRPPSGDGRVLTSGAAEIAIMSSMYSESRWPVLTEAFTALETSDDPTGMFELADAYVGRDAQGRYEDNMMEANKAITCLDVPVERDPQTIVDQNEQLAAVTPIGVPGITAIGDVICQEWPYESRVTPGPVTGAGAAPVLVVGTTGDPATPVEWAEALAGQLESGVLITFEGEGHIAYTQQDPCVNGAVDAYFVDGTVPEDGLRC